MTEDQKAEKMRAALKIESRTLRNEGLKTFGACAEVIATLPADSLARLYDAIVSAPGS